MEENFNAMENMEIEGETSAPKRSRKNYIIFGILGIIVIAAIVIILYFVLRDKDDDKDDDIAEFSFRAIYEINEVNKNIKLMNDEYKDNIIKMKINKEKISGCTNYTFRSPGNYTVYVVLNTEKISSLALFNNSENLAEIYFSKEFKLNDITSLDNLFHNCINLLSADISNLNFEKIISMDSMFSNCFSLKTIKFPNSNTPNLESMELMFVNCNNLASIDITKFNTEKVYNMLGLFLVAIC